MEREKMSIYEVVRHFAIPGVVTSIEPYGDGHINDTYRVQMEDGIWDYLLQRLNSNIFLHPDQVQMNIMRVTHHLREVIRREHGDPSRESLQLFSTKKGATYYLDEEGKAWRLFLFISNSVGGGKAGTTEELYEAGTCFGTFQRRLSDFRAEDLYEIIPRFHDTPWRVTQLREAMERDAAERLESVQELCAFCLEREEEAAGLQKALEEGKIHKRVTHNDTKTNNCLFDQWSGRAICVCDLDTVMPGIAAYDFGDAIRFGANLAEEDDPDESHVSLSVERAQAFADGFIGAAGETFDETERRLLPQGIWTVTYEQAVRFLTDYLNGDTYYKTKYKEHNLDRTVNQLALLMDIEKKEASLKGLV